MLDFISRAVRAAVDVATLPVAVAADIATLGGGLTDRDESYTESKVRRIGRDASKLLDDVAG